MLNTQVSALAGQMGTLTAGITIEGIVIIILAIALVMVMRRK
jgi:hypothetical protein